MDQLGDLVRLEVQAQEALLVRGVRLETEVTLAQLDQVVKEAKMDPLVKLVNLGLQDLPGQLELLVPVDHVESRAEEERLDNLAVKEIEVKLVNQDELDHQDQVDRLDQEVMLVTLVQLDLRVKLVQEEAPVRVVNKDKGVPRVTQELQDLQVKLDRQDLKDSVERLVYRDQQAQREN